MKFTRDRPKLHKAETRIFTCVDLFQVGQHYAEVTERHVIRSESGPKAKKKQVG